VTKEKYINKRRCCTKTTQRIIRSRRNIHAKATTKRSYITFKM